MKSSKLLQKKCRTPVMRTFYTSFYFSARPILPLSLCVCFRPDR